VTERGAMLAINNSVASLAGIASSVVTGALIQDVPGARNYGLGFGLLGYWMIDPQRLRYAAT